MYTTTLLPPPSMGPAYMGSREIQMYTVLPLPTSLPIERLNPRDLQKEKGFVKTFYQRKVL